MPTMTDASSIAIKLNNLGAEKMALGEFNEAIHHLRQALAVVPHGGNGIEDAQGAIVDSDTPDLGIRFIAIDDTTPLPGQEDGAYFFHKPLVFSRPLPRTSDGACVLYGVAIFNMALAMDLMSKDQVDMASTRALRLYCCCIDVFMRTSFRSILSGAIAAALNNKARIYYRRRRYDDSSREMRYLESCWRPFNESGSKPAILEDSDIEGILINFLLFQPPSTAMAA